MRLAAFATAALTLLTAGCVDLSGCPTSVAEAESFEGATFAGVGYLVRFIPSPDPRYRGYDVSIVRTLHGNHVMDTVLLRLDQELEGLELGGAVLMVANRQESDRAYTPGRCTPLVPVAESDVEG